MQAQGLRDIVQPAPVSYRPRTVGWYVLFALLALAVFRAWRDYRRRVPRLVPFLPAGEKA